MIVRLVSPFFPRVESQDVDEQPAVVEGRLRVLSLRFGLLHRSHVQPFAPLQRSDRWLHLKWTIGNKLSLFFKWGQTATFLAPLPYNMFCCHKTTVQHRMSILVRPHDNIPPCIFKSRIWCVNYASLNFCEKKLLYIRQNNRNKIKVNEDKNFMN